MAGSNDLSAPGNSAPGSTVLGSSIPGGTTGGGGAPAWPAPLRELRVSITLRSCCLAGRAAARQGNEPVALDVGLGPLVGAGPAGVAEDLLQVYPAGCAGFRTGDVVRGAGVVRNPLEQVAVESSREAELITVLTPLPVVGATPLISLTAYVPC